MQQCSHVRDCSYYQNKVKGAEPINSFVKALYCHNKFEKCKRMLSSAHRPVSDDNNRLTPTGLNPDTRDN